MGDVEPEPTIFCNQARLPVMRWGHQTQPEILRPTICPVHKICWDNGGAGFPSNLIASFPPKDQARVKGSYASDHRLTEECFVSISFIQFSICKFLQEIIWNDQY